MKTTSVTSLHTKKLPPEKEDSHLPTEILQVKNQIHENRLKTCKEYPLLDTPAIKQTKNTINHNDKYNSMEYSGPEYSFFRPEDFVE